jgi:hypothetical protein
MDTYVSSIFFLYSQELLMERWLYNPNHFCGIKSLSIRMNLMLLHLILPYVVFAPSAICQYRKGVLKVVFLNAFIEI